jgi:hypothetical protein
MAVVAPFGGLEVIIIIIEGYLILTEWTDPSS